MGWVHFMAFGLNVIFWRHNVLEDGEHVSLALYTAI